MFKYLTSAFQTLDVSEPQKAQTTLASPATQKQLTKPIIPTSAHTLLSSLHGRNRRATRNIGKRDLQAALKYGTKESTHPNPRTREPRWKYTYKNIVYITEGERGTKEVTSYVEPLTIPEAFVQPADLDLHNRLAEKLRKQPLSH